MHKFTIFTILFSVFVVVVVAELVVNDYLSEYDSWDEAAGFVMPVRESEKSPLEDNVKPEEAGTEKPATSEPPDSLPPTSESEEKIITVMTDDFLVQAGFIEPSFKEVNFNGKVFQLIEVLAEDIGFVSKFNVFEAQDFAVSIYEARFGDEILAGSFYNFLREAGNNIPGFSVNESNSFGVGSFYVNVLEEQQKTVLLTVNFGKSVYSFEYPHKSHSKVKVLIGIIAKNE